MSVKILWELGEIYTAPLNLFLILLGMAYSSVTYGQFFSWRVLLFTFTLLLIHIAVNIFNNYMDYKNARDQTYRLQTNIIGREQLDLATVRNYFLFFLGLSFLSGLFLAYQSDFYVLILGGLGYYVGLGYSYGRKPINSLPIAETVPAILSGFMIPMMSAYLVSFPSVTLNSDFLLNSFLAFFPMILCMFNNLLANNTCDLEEDIRNGRHTLVYYLGKKASVLLLRSLTILIFFWVIATVLFQKEPWTLLILLALIPLIQPKLKQYFAIQNKQTTFPLVLKSMSLLMVGYPLLYFIGSLIY
ncbi:prenyltransferase [Candidatus Enterococcus huntleyi]|uniref:prenyltransferase n=1 Tax=Candidatus Enterococcus huntleyi TaxID=1857217 RepID=UPI001379EED8|nr:UbiA family prenyltransferase [Enterococcus sp. JM4C]